PPPTAGPLFCGAGCEATAGSMPVVCCAHERHAVESSACCCCDWFLDGYAGGYCADAVATSAREDSESESMRSEAFIGGSFDDWIGTQRRMWSAFMRGISAWASCVVTFGMSGEATRSVVAAQISVPLFGSQTLVSSVTTSYCDTVGADAHAPPYQP